MRELVIDLLNLCFTVPGYLGIDWYLMFISVRQDHGLMDSLRVDEILISFYEIELSLNGTGLLLY